MPRAVGRALEKAKVRRQRVLAAICASVHVMLQVASETARRGSRIDDTDDEWRAFQHAYAAGTSLLKTLEARQQHLGHGRSLFPRLPTLLAPKE